MSFVAALGDRFRSSADHVMMVTADGRRYTYAEIHDRAAAFADHAAGCGVRPGDAIAVEMSNGVDMLVWYFACFFGGYVMVPVNPELSPEDRAHIRRVVAPTLSVGEDTVVDASPRAGRPMPPSWPDDRPGVIFFTSGTTDRPKGVMHSWATLIGNVTAFNRRCDIRSDTRMLHVLPMAYMAGFLNTVLSPVVAGGTAVVGQRFGPRSMLDFWSLPSRERVNDVWLTPSIAVALLRSSRDDAIARAALADFKHVFCGTAPLHDALRSDFLTRFGRPLQESYGTSEQLLLSAQSPEDALVRRDVGSVLDTADLDFVESEPGIREIVVGSRHLGYLTAEGIVPPVTDAHGRTGTGDAGRLVDGRLEITGRLKDLIIRGGINVSPVAVENALADIDGVCDVAVVGLPHAFWGEIIVACLEVAPGTDEQAVVAMAMNRARERLAKAFQPDRVVAMPAFPRATTGKIQKRLLREGLAG